MAYDKWVAFDFDGVIASYDGWKGFDVLGEPNHRVIAVMNILHEKGIKITILTTRLDTPVVRQWLKDNKVPYDSINSSAHNPPNTSQKPIYHVIVDDRAVNYHNQGADHLLDEIDKIVKTV